MLLYVVCRHDSAVQDYADRDESEDTQAGGWSHTHQATAVYVDLESILCTYM